MTNLQDDTERIEQFVLEGLQQFLNENGTPKVMGIYCCPSGGWITLNFNKGAVNSSWYISCRIQTEKE